VHLLLATCEWRLQACEVVRAAVKAAVDTPLLTADILRAAPCGADSQGRRYYSLTMHAEDPRLYRETPWVDEAALAEKAAAAAAAEAAAEAAAAAAAANGGGVVPKPKRPRMTKDEAAAKRAAIRERGPGEPPAWETVCVTLEELSQLGEEFVQGKGKERQLGNFLVNSLVPNVEASAVARDLEEQRRQQMLEAIPRKRSGRIASVVRACPPALLVGPFACFACALSTSRAAAGVGALKAVGDGPPRCAAIR
jgi:hypothetical protein